MIKFCTVYPYDLNVLFNTVNVFLKTLRNRVLDTSIYEKVNRNRKINRVYDMCSVRRGDSVALKSYEGIKKIERAIYDCNYIEREMTFKFMMYNFKEKLYSRTYGFIVFKAKQLYLRCGSGFIEV